MKRFVELDLDEKCERGNADHCDHTKSMML